MIRKILKYLILLFLTYIAATIIYFYINNIFINRSNVSLTSYTPKNTYQEKYLISDYVDESFETYPLFRRLMLGSMFKYEEVIAQSNNFLSLIYIFENFFLEEYDYIKIISDLEIIEDKLISLKNQQCDVFEENIYTCTYDYVGYLPDIEAPIKGAVSLFYDGTYNLVVSFEEEGQISKQKAKLLADDSTAEMLTYLIIEETQEINETTMEPNEAAKYFYGNTIEQLAGSISYHAVIAYILEEYEIQDQKILYEKVQEVNITQEDADSFFVNRSY